MDYKKAGIYSRKSKFTGKGESTQNQVQLCKEYAEKHFGIKEFIIYEDEGFSGGDTDRPQYKRMIKDAKNKKFDVLICYRLDRISRNISDFSSTIEVLQDNNIGFVSIREQFDTSTPMGRAMMYIASVFAQLERETIAERIKDNMRQLARSGRWLGGNTPTGYASEPIIYLDNNMKEKKMFKLTPIKEELETVKLIFDKYLELGSLSQVHTYLMNNDIKTKKNKYFQRYAIRTILRNPVYAKADKYVYDYFDANKAQIADSKEDFDGRHGIMAYNKNLVKKGQSVKQKDISEWIIAIGKHQGIISGKDWVQVQNMLNKNKALAPRQGTSGAALLSGFLRCKKCGSFMRVKYGQRSRETGELLHYYVCQMKIVSRSKKCDNKNLIGRYTDEEVVNQLRELINSGLINDIEKKKRELKDRNLQKNRVLKKIDDNKKSIENLLEQLKQNKSETVSKYIFAEIERLDRENRELEKNIEQNNTDVEEFNIDLLKENMIQFMKTFDNEDLQVQRMRLRNIIDHITWDGEELDIKLLEIN